VKIASRRAVSLYAAGPRRDERLRERRGLDEPERRIALAAGSPGLIEGWSRFSRLRQEDSADAFS
jgi:hypothetical protein